MMRVLILVAVVGLAPLAARGDVVRTIDGRVIEGTVAGDASGALVVTPRDGATVRLRPEEIAQATLGAAQRDEADPRGAEWAAQDIGKVAIPGRSDVDGRRMAVWASGDDIGNAKNSTRDQFRFVHRPLTGDGEVVARVLGFTQYQRDARVGVMVRQDLFDDAPNALAYLSADRAGFQFRRDAGDHTERAEAKGRVRLPCWLKIERRGRRVTAYRSEDGAAWTALGAATLDLPPTAYVGLAVTSRKNTRLTTARFDKCLVTAAPTTAPAATVRRPAGVVLRSGTFLAGEVVAVDAAAVRYRGADGRDVEVGRDRVARIRLSAAAPEPGGAFRAGLALRQGDFVDGELRSIAGGVVLHSSLLFGVRAWGAGEVADVSLGPVTAKPPRYEVRMRNGSILRAQTVRFTGTGVVVDEPGLGRVEAPLRDVRAFGTRLDERG